MHHLFWGLFFVLMDLNTSVGRVSFDVLPDFVGFFLLMKGMEELTGKVSRFEKSRHVAFGMFLLSAVLFGAGLLNQEAMTAVWLWVLDFGCVIVFLWLLRQILLGLEAPDQLKGLYPMVAVVQILFRLLGWVPLVGRVCGVAISVTGAVFLIAFRNMMKKSAE